MSEGNAREGRAEPARPQADECRRRSARRRIGWFVLVGCCAAIVHWLAVVWLVGHHGWHPLAANVLAWLLALTVSFSGHLRLTFHDSGATLASSAPRFLVISALGFAINETAYALLLGWSGLRYDLVLAAVLVCVAVVTYGLSRHWAFRGKTRH